MTLILKMAEKVEPGVHKQMDLQHHNESMEDFVTVNEYLARKDFIIANAEARLPRCQRYCQGLEFTIAKAKSDRLEYYTSSPKPKIFG